MSRYLETEPLEIAELPELSEPETEFCMGLLRNQTASESWRLAYPDRAKNCQNNTIWVKAAQLKASDKVRIWMREAQRAGLHAGVTDLGQYVAECRAMKAEALEAGNIGAAVNALSLEGKASGFDKLKLETDKDQIDMTQLVAAMESAGWHDVVALIMTKLTSVHDEQPNEQVTDQSSVH